MTIFEQKLDKNSNLPIGRFGISLTPKTKVTLKSRMNSLYIQQRLNWVEDGLLMFIAQALGDSVKLSDYLRLKYPEDMPREKRSTDSGDERKTLKFRIRYMLRSLELASERYIDFVQWQSAGLMYTLDAFAEIVRQALGEEAHEATKNFIARFTGIWKAVNPQICSAADASRELKKLVDEADTLFETLLEKALSIETKAAVAEVGNAGAPLENAIARLEKATEANTKSARVVARVAGLAAAKIAEDEEAATRFAGLCRFNDAQRREIEIAIEKSHSGYIVSRGGKGPRTISSLAENCWREHKEDFESLARLPVAAGFKNEKSYKSALYRLAKQYPAADHFRWAVEG